MTGGNGEFLDVRLCSDDIPERERIPYVREIYGRAILRHEIEPCRDSRFYWRSALRSMSGLGLATPVVRVGWPDQFIEHGKVEGLRSKYGISVEGVMDKLIPVLAKKMAERMRTQAGR